MDKPIAGRLLKRFDSLELRQVTRAASELGAVNPATVEKLIQEFSEQFSAGAELLGSAGEAENLLAGALDPEEAAESCRTCSETPTRRCGPPVLAPESVIAAISRRNTRRPSRWCCRNSPRAPPPGSWRKRRASCATAHAENAVAASGDGPDDEAARAHLA